MAHVRPLEREQLVEFEPFFQVVEVIMGFVPNSLLTLGRRPDILRAFASLTRTVLGAGSIEPGLKQLVALVASTAAGCRYCQAHTAASASRLGVDTDRIARAWEFEQSPRFDDRERAALRLARDASLVPNATAPVHFESLRAHFDEGEIVELLAVISLFGWLNRWNDTMATELESEPFSLASAMLQARGWQAGKHAPPARGG